MRGYSGEIRDVRRVEGEARGRERKEGGKDREEWETKGEIRGKFKIGEGDA